MRHSARLTISLLLLLPGLSWAIPRLSGTLVKVDSGTGTVVIRTQSGLRTIQVDSKAHIERGGSPSRLSAFRVGEPVQIEIGSAFNVTPMIGVGVYDNASAANIGPPAAPAGVYGQPVGTMETAGGAVTLGRPSSVNGALSSGGTNQNLQTIMNQNAMGPAINAPATGPYTTNATGQFQPAPGPYNGSWQQPNTGAVPSTPGSGWQSSNASQGAGPGWQSASSPQGTTSGGWTSAPGGTGPVPAPAGSNPGYSTNPTTGWSSSGAMGTESTVDGVIRNIDPNRALLFVAPYNGGTTVGVKISIATVVRNQQSATVPLNQIQLGSSVHVQGTLAGNQLVARIINIGQ